MFVLSTDVSRIPVGLRDVARRFKADCEYDLKPATKKRKVDVDLTRTSPASVAKREVWIAFQNGLVLYNEHRRIISDGEWLSDLHINAAQTLLKQQFPHVPGLQDPTLAEMQTFDAQSGEFVQVLHTAGCHWVAVA